MRATIARLVAGLFVASLSASASSAQQFTMKLSLPTINDSVHEYFKRIKAGVEERSNGRVRVQIYPANQLGQLPVVVEGVALGTIEAAASANGFWVSLEPRFQVFDAPGLFDGVLHGIKVTNDPEIRARMATFGADKGVEILSPGIYSPMMLLTHKGVRSIADFQGQKVRTQGGAPIQVEPFKKLGVIPVSLPLGEALPAMQNKTIDGMIAGIAPFVVFKYYDIAKPVTFLPATTLVAPIVANRRFMKSLGPELEAIVREEARKAEAVFADWNMADIKKREELWIKNGGEIVTLPPADAKRYLDIVGPVTEQVLSANPKSKEDYAAFLAAAKKHR
jgi:TRAP-type C4-dicarboxylate transport system substrate-binding protein